MFPSSRFTFPLLSYLCLTFLAAPCKRKVKKRASCRKGSPKEAFLCGAVMREADHRLQGNIVCPTVWPCYQDTAVTHVDDCLEKPPLRGQSNDPPGGHLLCLIQSDPQTPAAVMAQPLSYSTTCLQSCIFRIFVVE